MHTSGLEVGLSEKGDIDFVLLEEVDELDKFVLERVWSIEAT